MKREKAGNPYSYFGVVTSVYDGDTITATLQLGFGISYEMKLRLLGIDTKEIRNKNLEEKRLAIKTRDFVREKILNKKVKIKTYKKGKYGRYLVDVFLDDGTLLNNLLIKKGYAKEYWGGKR